MSPANRNVIFRAWEWLTDTIAGMFVLILVFSVLAVCTWELVGALFGGGS